MKALELHQMEKIEGGDWSWGGCLRAVSGVAVTGVGALAAWQVALIAGSALCVAGGLGAFDE